MARRRRLKACEALGLVWRARGLRRHDPAALQDLKGKMSARRRFSRQEKGWRPRSDPSKKRGYGKATFSADARATADGTRNWLRMASIRMISPGLLTSTPRRCGDIFVVSSTRRLSRRGDRSRRLAQTESYKVRPILALQRRYRAQQGPQLLDRQFRADFAVKLAQRPFLADHPLNDQPLEDSRLTPLGAQTAPSCGCRQTASAPVALPSAGA